MATGQLAREIRDIARGAEHTHTVLRERLVRLIVASLLVDAVASVLVLLSERDSNGTQITNLGDAVFWTTAQLLTVSSQMPNPLTTAGRALDLGLEFYAIVVITALAGSFSSFLSHRERDRRRRDGVES
jgi:hypothetical protein